MKWAFKNRDDRLAYLLVLLIYVPSNTIGNLIRLAAVGFVFVVTMRRPVEPAVKKLSLMIGVSPFIPIAFVVLLEHNLNIALVTHEIMRMLFCALAIVAASKLKISKNGLYLCCVLAVVPNFVIQLLQYQGNEPVFDFIRSNYMDVTSEKEWTHLELARGKGSDFRSGSIFLNPNVYMVIPLLASIVFCKQDREEHSVWNYLMLGVTMISCFFTGSRTSTVVMVFVLGLYLIRFSTGKRRTVMIAVIILMVIIFGRNAIFGSRAFTLSMGNTDSLTVKLKGFFWYWQSTLFYPLYWITGSLGSYAALGIDCEWGHIYTWYGVYGVYWYVQLLQVISRRNEEVEFYSKVFAYVCGLMAITASVLLCMPIYSFVGLLTFAGIERKEMQPVTKEDMNDE